MNIRIDDDVPLPQPDKPDTWISVSTPSAKDDGWVKAAFDAAPKRVAMKDLEPKYVPVEHLSRYPAETTYDAKGVPTVDCYLVGGPLNGKHGPIVGTAQVVELEVYAPDGSVLSVELYELGDRKELGGRYWKATKE